MNHPAILSYVSYQRLINGFLDFSILKNTACSLSFWKNIVFFQDSKKVKDNSICFVLVSLSSLVNVPSLLHVFIPVISAKRLWNLVATDCYQIAIY